MADGVFQSIAKGVSSSGLADSKNYHKSEAPKSAGKPAGFYSGASYKMAHAAIPPISPVKAPEEPKADIETP